MPSEAFLVPGWRVDARVGALMSTRAGGVSAPPFDTLNLRWPDERDDAFDDADAVRENRRRFVAAMGGAQPVWLNQVHGAEVVRLHAGHRPHAAPRADAALTADAGVACTVLVADCLPVLFAAPAGRAVAAAHAGWRGLAAGVLEAAVAALAEAAACAPAEIAAWMGPCIGPRRFEVGEDVLRAFGAAAADRFEFRPRADGSARWLADLPGLARDRLAAAGVRDVSGGAWCTVEDASRFFSFRRDRITGRMAAAIWLR